MRYLSEDGKVFNSVEECRSHEEKQLQYKEERKKALKAVEKSYQDYIDSVKNFNEKYSDSKILIQDHDLMEVLKRFIDFC